MQSAQEIALTPTLSPRRGRSLARPWKTRMLRLPSPLLCLSFRRHTTTKLGRITKARPSVSPSPGGEGRGEGERSSELNCFGLWRNENEFASFIYKT